MHPRQFTRYVVPAKTALAFAWSPRPVRRYDAAGLLGWYPTRAGLDAQPLAHVQIRTSAGAIHSAVISVVWETGGIVVRGWPLDPGSGWVVG